MCAALNLGGTLLGSRRLKCLHFILSYYSVVGFCVTGSSCVASLIASISHLALVFWREKEHNA